MARRRVGPGPILGEGLPHLLRIRLLVLDGGDIQHGSPELQGGLTAGADTARDRAGALVRVPARARRHPRLGWGADNPAVCHTCDNRSCQRPEHLRLGTAAENRAEWLARRNDPSSPLADFRGPASRSHVIGAAIRAGQGRDESEAEVVARIRAAIVAGRPLSLWRPRTPSHITGRVAPSVATECTAGSAT
ncbi:HNH endonuclease [Streptomyces sp. M19]